MPTFKIIVSYDGTEFVGWQRQAEGISVQGLLEEALSALDGRPVAVAGAGRTDAGVHALGQTAGFSLDRGITADVLLRAINAHLPPTVRVIFAESVPDDFHARFDAREKTYRYRIWNEDVISPFERQYAWHVPGALDVEAMASAARQLEGTHDFAAFQGSGSAPLTTTIRTVFSSRVERTGESGVAAAPGVSTGQPLVVYEITGDGFLRHMVRNIVGTLVEVGRRRRTAGSIREVLASRDRGSAGPTAPAEGLFLVRVGYETRLAAER